MVNGPTSQKKRTNHVMHNAAFLSIMEHSG